MAIVDVDWRSGELTRHAPRDHPVLHRRDPQEQPASTEHYCRGEKREKRPALHARPAQFAASSAGSSYAPSSQDFAGR